MRTPMYSLVKKGLDVSSEDNVNKILDNLAHKIYYHNYVMVKETFKVL